MNVLLVFMCGWMCGFLHARFSDYALKNGLWPYNKNN